MFRRRRGFSRHGLGGGGLDWRLLGAIGAVALLAAFVFLTMSGAGLKPERQAVRVEVSDAFKN